MFAGVRQNYPLATHAGNGVNMSMELDDAFNEAIMARTQTNILAEYVIELINFIDQEIIQLPCTCMDYNDGHRCGHCKLIDIKTKLERLNQ